jgi:hypothetical protein
VNFSRPVLFPVWDGILGFNHPTGRDPVSVARDSLPFLEVYFYLDYVLGST